MSTSLNEFDEHQASIQTNLLHRLLGCHVISMIRDSEFSPTHIMNAWPGGIGPEMVFSVTMGPLFLTLDSGLVVGFASSSSLASITLWVERDENGHTSHPLFDSGDNEESYMIPATDTHYCRPEFSDFLQRKILSLQVLKRPPQNVLYECLPRETCLVIRFDSGTALILSHGVYANLDDFFVLLERDIPSDVLQQFEELLSIRSTQ